jgi:hypothetical protein
MDHPNVTHFDDVDVEEVDVGELRGRRRDLGSAAGAFRAGVSLVEIAPSWGTREPNDIAYYPDSGKVFLCGVGVIGRIEPCDYWDGEEDPAGP